MSSEAETEGTIFDIKRYAIHDGPGIRVTVFLKGCPLQCWWCHNPESRNSDTGRKITLDKLLFEIEKDNIFFEESNGGVTFSGGEPLMQHEFLAAALNECKKRKIHIILDTSGYASPEIFNKIIDSVDLFLYDLKLIDNDAHEKFTGTSNDLILQNLRVLDKAGKNIIIRFPVIPGITNADENITGIAEFLKSLENDYPVNLLPFHRIAGAKYERLNIPNRMQSAETPTAEMIQNVKSRFEELGIAVKEGE